jgi:hypothetical protein
LDNIDERIKEIKAELMALGDLRPGSITKQYRRPKEKEGAFYQISYTHKMKSKSDYVRKGFINEMKKQTKEYKNMKALMEEWIDLGIEKSKILMKTGVYESSKGRQSRELD